MPCGGRILAEDVKAVAIFAAHLIILAHIHPHFRVAQSAAAAVTGNTLFCDGHSLMILSRMI